MAKLAPTNRKSFYLIALPRAADLRFPHHLRHTRLGTSKSKSGTRIIDLLVPLASEVRVPGAAMYHELRKRGTRAGGRPGPRGGAPPPPFKKPPKRPPLPGGGPAGRARNRTRVAAFRLGQPPFFWGRSPP